MHLEESVFGPPETGGEPVRFEPSARRIRVHALGRKIADTSRARLMLAPRRIPVYYVPIEDVLPDMLVRSEVPLAGPPPASPWAGVPLLFDLRIGERVVPRAAWQLTEPRSAGLRGIDRYVAFYWAKMDAWFEEDEEVFVHARDPYSRVDVLDSSRHVKVVTNGVVVAETRAPRAVFETNLPPRFYIPKVDVRMDLLAPSATRSACPYKGTATYWSLATGEASGQDLAWTYPAPLLAAAKIANLVCFYAERVDEFLVDGAQQQLSFGPPPADLA